MIKNNTSNQGKKFLDLKKILPRGLYNRISENVENKLSHEKQEMEDITCIIKNYLTSTNVKYYTYDVQPIDEKFSLSYYNIKELNDINTNFLEQNVSSLFNNNLYGKFIWDPLSPLLLEENQDGLSLRLPAYIVSKDGNALDYKTSFDRSLQRLNEVSVRLQKFLGNRFAKNVELKASISQDFYIIPIESYLNSSDLRKCNKVLLDSSVEEFVDINKNDFDFRLDKFKSLLFDFCLKTNIPLISITVNNSKYHLSLELGFLEAKNSVNSNLLIMKEIKKIANICNLYAIFEEKPFLLSEPSKKRISWYFEDNNEQNYFETSKSPLRNLTFLLSIGAFMYGLDEYGDVLLSSVASVGNERRLIHSDNESSFVAIKLGSYITDFIEDFININRFSEKKISGLNLRLQQHNLKTNYTEVTYKSPINFKGNKFEFDLLGSNANPSEVLCTFATIISSGYQYIIDRLQDVKGDPRLNAYPVLKEIFINTSRLHYEGQYNSNFWFEEAVRRKLRKETNAPKSILIYNEIKSKELFIKQNILNEKEINYKVNSKLSNYCGSREKEFKLFIELVKGSIIPQIQTLIDRFTQTSLNLKNASISTKVFQNDIKFLLQIYDNVTSQLVKLENTLLQYEKEDDIFNKAFILSIDGNECIQEIRELIKTVKKKYKLD